MEKCFIINVYDFDKTIYDGDSTIDFYLFCICKNPILVFLLPITILYFIIYKLKFIDKLKFKEKFFSFLKYIKNIDNLVQLFWERNKKKIKPWFINDNSSNKIIISVSPEFLLRYIINEINVIDIIGTKVNKHTGKFESKNCYGKEKVKRLNEKYSECLIEKFFSDSKSDKYLAQISKTSFLVKKDVVKRWYV